MLVQEEIKALVLEALKTVGANVSGLDIKLTRPQREGFGDFSTNILFTVAKDLDRNVSDLGQEVERYLQKNLEKDMYPDIERVERVNKGFLNFFVKDEYFVRQLRDESFKNVVVEDIKVQGKDVVVEYTDPNPFKAFHIGHLMTNTIGESIARLLEAGGANVKRLNYQGDVGMHVAKSVWGAREKMKKEGLALGDVEKWSLDKRIAFLGEAYALGASMYVGDNELKQEIEKLNTVCYIAAQERLVEEEGWELKVDLKKVLNYSEEDLEWVREIYRKGRKWSLEYFEQIYKLLGTKFDKYYFESKVGDVGLSLVKENVGKVFEESNGAIVFKGEDYGLHTRVFVNKKGLPVYEAKDLALAFMKYEDFAYDKSFIITANEIDEYFKVVLKALEQINSELAKKTIHISHGMLRLTSGKMSSRTGQVITGVELLNEIKKNVEKVVGKERDFKEGEKRELLDRVAVGAWKYSVLKQQIGKDIVFDMDKSVALEGKSGPYLQYTYARAKSVLRKASSAVNATNRFHLDTKLTKKERNVLKILDAYSDILATSIKEYAPHVLALYLYDLAQEFNSFYNDSQILVDLEDLRAFRLSLTNSVAQILKNGLNILGIETVERM